VYDHDHLGRPRALRWVAHDPGNTDLRLLDLEVAHDIDEAVQIANACGLPAQNFIVADASGRVGWTLIGPIPRRFGFDGRRPSSWADGDRGWDGTLTPAEYPRLLDPENGRLWTANNRTVDGEMLAKIGNGGFGLGARAGQIRDDLFELERASERDLLAIQLDDRALFLERWRQVLLETLDDAAVAEDPRRGVLRRAVLESWTGHASVDSVAYRMVRGFRRFLARQVFEPLTAVCETADEQFSFFSIGQSEGPLWKLVSERPEHLLNPVYASWREQLLAAADDLIDYFTQDEVLDLSEKTWGDYNTVRLRHPLSQAVPFLSDWLDTESVQLPGDSNMPRVQTPGFGASERLIVSPGREQDGIFHLPGGASGHPLSPFYRSGHDAWVHGEPSSFLPGTTVHSLTLQPE
jgi:penicillin amidase